MMARGSDAPSMGRIQKRKTNLSKSSLSACNARPVPLPDILAKRTDVLSPRMAQIVADLASDWRQLDERIEAVTDEIKTLAKSDDSVEGS